MDLMLGTRNYTAWQQAPTRSILWSKTLEGAGARNQARIPAKIGSVRVVKRKMARGLRTVSSMMGATLCLLGLAAGAETSPPTLEDIAHGYGLSNLAAVHGRH
jgi:hypothetical protein